MKKIFFIILAFGLGLGGGLYVMWRTNKVTLPIPTTVYYALGKPQVLGFLPYWTISSTQTVYPNLTTLAYFSLQIGSDGKIQKMASPGEEEPGWTWLKSDELSVKLRKAREAGQTLSLVVFSGNDKDIYKLIDDPQTHGANLVDDVVPIMNQYGFTDLNLDVESPNDASEAARQKFTEFARIVKMGLGNKTLSIDIQALSALRPYITDPEELGKFADQIMVMTYDYHYPGSALSGPIAPMDGAGINRVTDVTMAIKSNLEKIPAKKILLGIPLYGYEWTTISDLPGSPAIPGTGVMASAKRVSDFVSKCNNCVTGRDETSREPYVIYPLGNAFNQMWYEDATSLGYKLQLAKAMKLGGVGMWALGYEDDLLLKPLEGY